MKFIELVGRERETEDYNGEIYKYVQTSSFHKFVFKYHQHQSPVFLTLNNQSSQAAPATRFIFKLFIFISTAILFFISFRKSLFTFKMFCKALIVVLSASSLVAGHGKPVVFKGDVGGNGTALAIQGAVVAATGPNSKVSNPKWRCSGRMNVDRFV